MSWLSKNWWKLLIVPFVLYAAYKLFRIFYVFITSKTSKPDLSGDKEDLDSDIGKITSGEVKRIDEIKKEGEEKKVKITSGEIKPADVFNEQIKRQRIDKVIKEEVKNVIAKIDININKEKK